NGWYTVGDASGVTGARLNGDLVIVPQRLMPGDVITVGAARLRFAQTNKEVPLTAMHGNYSSDIFDYIGDSSQSWVMVARSKKVLEKLRKLDPPKYEETKRQMYLAGGRWSDEGYKKFIKHD